MFEKKQLKLDPEYLSEITHTNSSITAWSVKYGSLSLELRGVEVQLAGLYEGRDTLLKKFVEEKAQIPISQISQMGFNPSDGTVEIVLKQSKPTDESIPDS